VEVIDDSGRPDDDLIDFGHRRPSGPGDWSFARRPKWIVSHLFAATLIVAFVGAGLWQLDRLGQRQDSNDRIEARALQSPVPLTSVLGAPDDALDFVAVSSTGRFIESELTRVANRSQDGRGGDWSVGVFETNDGQLLVVNRGFVLRSEIAAEAPGGEVEINGFLRLTRTKGWIGGTDNPEAERMPRLNVDDVVVRLEAAGIRAEGRTIPLWLQLDSVDGLEPDAQNGQDPAVDAVVTPRPVPLDALSNGNHFSYAVQWFSLAVLSIVIYGLMLRRISTRSAD
jgi:surfeit locus 1 family protein